MSQANGQTEAGDAGLEGRPAMPVAHRLWREARERNGLGDRDLVELADRWGIPEGRLRTVANFFPRFSESDAAGEGTAFACEGFFCGLAGGGRATAGDRAFSCPGMCDRAPVRWHPKRGFAAGTAELSEPAWDPEVELATPTVFRLARTPAFFTASAGESVAGDLYSPAFPGLRGETLLEEIGRLGPRDRRNPAVTLVERWRRAAETAADQRFVIAHAGPGDPGSQANRQLMVHEAARLLRGMECCGRAIGATEGVIHVGSENPATTAAVEEAVNRATAAGFLGTSFDVTVVPGFGSYVGGEETALLNAVEGRRGEARVFPPEPEISGLFGRPVALAEAETFVLLAALGETPVVSPATRLAAVFGDGFARPGLAEIDGDTSVRAVLEAAGVADSAWGLLFGGPRGTLLLPDEWDLLLDPAEWVSGDIRPGNWSFYALTADHEPRDVARRLLDYAAAENCGKCDPCRLGTLAARDLVKSGREPRRFGDILTAMEMTSLCDFGRQIPGPVRKLARAFGEKIFARA
ncbi:MAG: hypothetical protein KDM91_07540 [Verrucomicrobiae bacterium]|nr:hypothetical protein [Verrucomicrobiae bacterium]